MGMFDSVYYICASCKKKVEWQSKAGHCVLNAYYPPAVPLDIANDINKEVKKCDCGRMYQINVDDLTNTISMKVEEIE